MFTGPDGSASSRWKDLGGYGEIVGNPAENAIVSKGPKSVGRSVSVDISLTTLGVSYSSGQSDTFDAYVPSTLQAQTLARYEQDIMAPFEGVFVSGQTNRVIFGKATPNENEAETNHHPSFSTRSYAKGSCLLSPIRRTPPRLESVGAVRQRAIPCSCR